MGPGVAGDGERGRRNAGALRESRRALSPMRLHVELRDRFDSSRGRRREGMDGEPSPAAGRAMGHALAVGADGRELPAARGPVPRPGAASRGARAPEKSPRELRVGRPLDGRGPLRGRTGGPRLHFQRKDDPEGGTIVRILGISGLYHDSAAALVKDGVIVAAAEEERFSRKKGDASFPKRAIDFCLQMEGVRAEDLDFVVFYEKPFEKFDRLLSTLVDSIPRSFRVFRSSMLSWFRDKLWIRAQICERLGVRREKELFSEHHLSHAASAFFCSPFDDAAVMTMDGVGEWSTGTLGKATGREGGPCSVDLLLETRFPHSLGMLYSAFTAFLGFEVNEGEYKVMGMAPTGSRAT